MNGLRLRSVHDLCFRKYRNGQAYGNRSVNIKIVHDFVGTGSFLGINMLRWKHGIDAEILEAAAYEARRQQLERRLQL